MSDRTYITLIHHEEDLQKIKNAMDTIPECDPPRRLDTPEGRPVVVMSEWSEIRAPMTTMHELHRAGVNFMAKAESAIGYEAFVGFSAGELMQVAECYGETFQPAFPLSWDEPTIKSNHLTEAKLIQEIRKVLIEEIFGLDAKEEGLF